MKRPDASDRNSIRYRLRKARFRHIERLLDGIIADRGRASILDMGGRREYWKLLDQRYRDRVSVTIVNLEEEVRLEDQADDFGVEIRTIAGDATSLPGMADGSFDLTHSNSVIEHVGLYGAMAAFARETRRIGRAYYLQTPNFWFPLEPHYGVPFFHWLPEPTRLALHTRLNVGFAARTDWAGAAARVDHTRIVSRGLLRALFPDGTQESERFAMMTKSLIVYRPA